jgi:hypothetical protein
MLKIKKNWQKLAVDGKRQGQKLPEVRLKELKRQEFHNNRTINDGGIFPGYFYPESALINSCI